MTILPVIVRELRAQSRQPLTYWLRVLAAGAVVGVFGFFLWRLENAGAIWITTGVPTPGGTNPFAQLGAMLFGQLNAALFLCNALLAPILTADCISRERREGTLGLLFLTRLSAAGIVTGKSFVHALRGVTLFAAMLPALALPILLGGVSAQDCMVALLIDSIVLILALVAGLLASSFTLDWIKSIVVAECLSVAFVGTFLSLHARSLEGLSTMVGASVLSHGGSLLDKLIELFCFHTNFWPGSSYATFWGGSRPNWWGSSAAIWGSLPPRVHSEWLRLLLSYLGGAVIFLLAVIVLAALRVRKSWRQEPAFSGAGAMQGSLTRARFAVGFLRRRLSRTLDRNPIGWLHQYSWNARMTKWGWCLLVVLVESFLAVELFHLEEGQLWVLLLFFVGLAFSAAGSFRRERESGALELLLVCPLRVNQIIGGRLRGIWMQFLPTALVVAVSSAMAWSIASLDWEAYLPIIAAYITIPLIGLFLSMCRVNFLLAWLLTLLLGLFIPYLLLANGLPRSSLDDRIHITDIFFLQLGVGAICWFLLHYRLKHRRFTLTYV